VQITVAHIAVRAAGKNKVGSDPKDAAEALTKIYLTRSSPYARCQSEIFRSEEDFLEWLGKQSGRTPVFPVLLDGRGKQYTSESFAEWLGLRRDEGTQHIVFAIGPADGWSDAARKRALMLLSLGQMTLAHALARAVLAEQIYRAFAILAGHPYHDGHK